MGILSEVPFLTSLDVLIPPALLEPHPKINPYVALATILGLIIITVYGQSRKHQKIVPGIPIVGGSDKESVLRSRKRFVHDGKSMLLEGYGEWKNSFFYVPSRLGERLMLPVKYLEDLKTAPVDKVDFVATFQEMFEGKYTTMGSRSTLHPRVVKAQLNHHLADVMPGVQEEIRNAFEEDFPTCEEWTEVPVVERITQIVARVSSRMFGGTVLSENKEWIKASIAFAVDGFIGAQAIKKFPEPIRPIAQYFLPELRNIKMHYEAAERAAIPLLEQRERDGEKAMDLLYWMADQAQGSEKDKKFIAGILLKVSFAAIHTSAAAPSQLIYDLCAMPEYIEPLRREMETVMTPDGIIDKEGFGKLVKLDSIMKESQRFNPLLLITFERVITEDYKLSDGFVIPAHTTIGIPTQAISMDPEFYPSPDRFDGFRFQKLRETTASSASTDATTEPQSTTSSGGGGGGRSAVYAASNHHSMAFGYGRHACPGRFFASHEIKAIMVHLLMYYDMKFPDHDNNNNSHDGGGADRGRPPSLLFETQNLPNPDAKVMFKRRR